MSVSRRNRFGLTNDRLYLIEILRKDFTVTTVRRRGRRHSVLAYVIDSYPDFREIKIWVLSNVTTNES